MKSLNATLKGADDFFTAERLKWLMESTEGMSALLEFCQAKSFSKEEATAREKLKALCAKWER